MKTQHDSDKSKDTGKPFTSGKEISDKEFKEGIRLAEEGPFYTVQESMKKFEEWVKEREKQ